MDLNLSSAKVLNNGVAMPLLGLGVWRAKEEETVKAVTWALEAGYRHIDTAKIYANEAAVGKAAQESGIPRKELFLTTKLWNDDMRAGRQLRAFEQSLKDLRTDYVDLYLIHWPVDGVFTRSWKIMEELYAARRIRAIGISNFHAPHLKTLLREAEVIPAVNQIECHPYLSQEPLIALCEKHGITAEAWSPLGGQGAPLMEDQELGRIGAQYGKTPVHVALRWNLQRGIIVLPKSVHKERVVANSQLYDFSLSDADMRAIDGLNRNKRLGPDPDNFTF